MRVFGEFNITYNLFKSFLLMVLSFSNTMRNIICG